MRSDRDWTEQIAMRKRLTRIAALTRKETIQLLRDRRTLVIILITPLLELLFLGYAMDLTVDHIPTAVADLSMDVQSRRRAGSVRAFRC